MLSRGCIEGAALRVPILNSSHMGDEGGEQFRGEKKKKPGLALHHHVAHGRNTGCHVAYSIRWVYYLVKRSVSAELHSSSSIAFYWLSTLFDSAVITTRTNDSVKHARPLRQYAAGL